MTDISVIIPTYNRSQLLSRTIKSLLAQNYPHDRYEIIVVDNGSTDNTPDIIAAFMTTDPKISYLAEPKAGLHNARHTGAKHARGQILLYIDDDVTTDRNLLSEIAAPYRDQTVGCVGGKILPEWEEAPPEWVSLFPKFYLSILDDEEGPKEAEWIFGCNFSIRKNLLFEVGGFHPDAFYDKNLWWYRGDGEIGLLRKVRKAGNKIIYTPKATVWHFIPKKRLTIKYFRERAFKCGIEESFSKFHYGKSLPTLPLFFRGAVFGLFSGAHHVLALLKGSDIHRVKASYYQARFLYEFRLGRDGNLRKFVKMDTWVK